MPLISLANISKMYTLGSETVTALDNVSLDIERGEMLAVIGPSGSGKSTMMNILGCLDTPTSGIYRFDGRDVSSLSQRALSQVRGEMIGFVFQKFHLMPELTALENVELPLGFLGLPLAKRRALAMDSLERVGLRNRVHHRPNELSGGQQQRVAIARAIASKPPLILADEPTGNLDSAAGVAVMELLGDLHREGHTVCIITHDNDIAAAVPRRIRLKDGRIV